MKVEIVKISGEKTGKQVELNEEIFGVEPNDHAIYLSVKQYLANQRQGTHKSKEKGESAGSTRKLHRQKVLVVHVKEVLKTLYFMVVEQFSVHVRATTVLN